MDPEDIKELQRIEQGLNDGRGMQTVKAILRMLEQGLPDLAQSIRCVDGDKTRQYPELEPVLYRMFGCRAHGVKGCEEWPCERKKPTPGEGSAS